MSSVFLLLILPLTFLVGAVTTPLASAECACQCMTGMPRTVCTTLEEARVKPSLCQQRMTCPDVTIEKRSDAELKRRFLPPEDKATNCRNGYFWDPVQKEYAILAKVCDIKTPVPAT